MRKKKDKRRQSTQQLMGVKKITDYCISTDADRFMDLEYVLLDTGREKRKLEIENVKYFKNLVILKFRGIDNINDIEMYKKRELWVPREEAQELEDDEYYIADLIGMDVVLEDGSKFGTLKDVMETGDDRHPR